MSKSKKDILNEMKQMAYLMGYDRSKTIFEQGNKKTNLLSEQIMSDELSSDLYRGADGTIQAFFDVITLGGVDWIDDWLSDKGDMGGGEKYTLGMSPETFPQIKKSIDALSIELGIDLWGKNDIRIISREQAKKYVKLLYKAMKGMGTNLKEKNGIIDVLEDVDSVLDLSRISYEFGTIEGETLEEWFDGDLSDFDMNKFLRAPLADKPFMIYKGKGFDSGAEVLTTLAKENKIEEKNPKADQEDFNTVFNALKGKGFDCVTEYLEGMEVGHTPKGVPYIMYVDGDTKLNLFANGRFSEPSTGEMGKIQPCVDAVKESIIRSISEQFTVKMDGSDEVRVIKDVKVDTTVDTTVDSDDTEGDVSTEKTTKTKKSSSWRKEPNTEPTEGDQSTIISKGHYNKNNDSNVKKIQKALGIKEDGLFGSDTKKSVSAYQKENGLTVDGVVGYETWVKMTSAGVGSEVTDNEEVGGETVNPKKEEEIIKKVEGMDPKEVLDSLKTMSAPNEDDCIMIVAAARDALPMKDVNATKILQACFKKYNFKRKTRKGVKKAYGIKGNGELRK